MLGLLSILNQGVSAMGRHSGGGRRATRARKREEQTPKPSELVKTYLSLFRSYPLPYQGLYTDEDSLEQPSALHVVPTTSSPGIEIKLNFSGV